MATFLTPILTESKGEIVFSEVLSNKLSRNYLCWHDVSIKSHKKKRERFPDFILFNPKHGLWIFEVKDWSLQYIIGHNSKQFTLAKPETVANPDHQAKNQAFALIDLLKKDSRLTKNGRLVVPVVWATVFSNITRDEFEHPQKFRNYSKPGKLGDIQSHRVLCADELKIPDNQFEERLLSMFNDTDILHKPLSKNTTDIIRDLIFPDIQILAETGTSRCEASDKVQLIDLEQERVLHELNDGTHIIFGVAGSGKTIILLNKARQLWDSKSYTTHPILYLCRGTCVANQIQQQAARLSLPRDIIFSFHQWCMRVLNEHHISVPKHPNRIFEKLFNEVRQGNISHPRYSAIFLDEGHDFKKRPEWLELITMMLNPKNSLLVVAYDDAQAIYGKDDHSTFKLGVLGNHEHITKHILRKNYRNTEQILLFAKVLANTYLVDSEKEDIPKVRPIGYGQRGRLPVLSECPSLDAELQKIAIEAQAFHDKGRSWSEIGVLFHTYDFDKLIGFATKIERFLKQHGIPCSRSETDFDKDLVKIMSITKAKGLGFSMVCLVGLSQTEFSADGREENEEKKREFLQEDIRYLYNGITRAIEELVVTYTKPKEGSLAYARAVKLQTALEKVRQSEPNITQEPRL